MRIRKKITVVGALAAAASLVASSPVMAAAPPPAAWDSQLGPAGYGCYAYTTYTSTIVTPHFWQQAGNPGNSCHLQVEHIGYDSTWNVIQYDNVWGPESTTGAATVVDGPNWYYGPWNGSGHMCVDISVWDDNGDAGSNWNFKEVC